MKRFFNISIWVILSLFFLVMGSLVFTQTALFRNLVKNQAENIINKNVNGKISIGSIHGNFLTQIEIHEIYASLPDGEPLLSLDKVSLKYSPWHLLKSVIKIDVILMERPEVFLRQENDSVWNFHHFLPQQEHPKAVPDSTQIKPFPFSIQIGSFHLSNGDIHLAMKDTIIPDRIENLDINLNGSYSGEILKASLNNISFKTQNPDLELRTLTLLFETNFQKYNIRNFYLETAHNSINANALYEGMDAFDADLNWPSVKTEEFAFALPDIVIPANPDFLFNAALKDDRLTFSLGLKYHKEEIQVSGHADGFSALSDSSRRENVIVNLDLRVDNFIPGNWIETVDLPLLLNTRLNISGNGLTTNSRPMRVRGSISGTKWENYLLETGDIDITYLAGDTRAIINILGDFGSLSTIASLNINDPNGPFVANIKTDNLAIHQILPEVVDSTWVTLQLDAEGEGVGTDNMTARFEGLLLNSIIEKVPIDSMFLSGLFADELLTLDTLMIKNQSVDVKLKADYSLSGDVHADLFAEIYNTKAFSAWFSQPADWEKLSLNLQAHGHTDSLTVSLSGQSSHLKLDTTFTVNSLEFIASGQLIKMKPDVELSLLATGIIASGNEIDTLTLAAEYGDAHWKALVTSILPEKMKLILDASGNIGDVMEIELHQLDFDSPYTDIALMDPPGRITYSDSIIQLQNFGLYDKNNEDFRLRAEAMFQHGDSLRLSTSIQNFNLELLSWFGISQTYIKGLANLDISVEGNRNGFRIDGHSLLDDVELEPLAVSRITTNIHYPGDTVKIETTIYNRSDESINIKAETPLIMSLSDSLVISWPQTVRTHLWANQTRLSGFFQNLPGIDQPKALMTINLIADGHIDDPHVKGSIDIINGEVPLPRFGINYNDIRLKLLVDGTDIVLDSLFVRHLNGSMLAQGKVVMDSTLFSGRVKSTDVSMRARQFYVTRHRDFEAQINADAFFRDVDDNPRFGGNIRVLRSSWNLPAIMQLAHDETELNDPLLVQAVRREQMAETEAPDTIRIREVRERRTGLMDQLTGTIKLNIPRNTWIRSPDMQMELFGDLDIVKNSEIFELFGNLGIHRGFYTLYGKRLTIRQGELNFTGGDTFDPIVNLRAEYVFRSRDRVRHVLTLIVSGRATDPEIRFELDGNDITEQDAMAYLLFGQPFDELSFGNQEGVSNAVPSRLLTGLVSAQLTRTIGSTFNLDMIEIDAGDNWQNTTFMVGKYITNNLFVTYQRSFGEAGSDAITPETITLEYEISRRLSLRLMQGDVKDSGVDLILKFER
ncbi:translocation/assembly module TamB domain-containing protein [Natronoflexus pectinivorans]|uniref:Autotransporter translocation and assembly factor TamB n=1 Tax=Natronoflexus pectinivorans TaxID=682526 RepID=A0A4R2GAL1_9BACT|nr:translocation/assembly module TamB [Natronoflexus pectinivorans]TCO04987.1 autotransporter translocation and assembly factor TamB [Natronoflexus pectinivorans]